MEKARVNVKLLSTLNSVLHMQAVDLRKAVGIAKSTWYDIMARPDTITIQHLLAVANGLHIPVRRLFSSGRADIVGKSEDYVTEPYTECYYDGDMLRKAVNDRKDTTWKRAGEVTGMTYQHIQKSLSSETRTPVDRFLAVCEEFGIDPFSILIDPNPELLIRQKKGGAGRAELLEQIDGLRNDIRTLSGTVDDLKRKYETLLEAHAALARRVSVNIGNVNGSHISIAADERPEPKPDK